MQLTVRTSINTFLFTADITGYTVVNYKYAGRNVFLTEINILVWTGAPGFACLGKFFLPLPKEMKSSPALILSKLLTDIQKLRQTIVGCFFLAKLVNPKGFYHEKMVHFRIFCQEVRVFPNLKKYHNKFVFSDTSEFRQNRILL